MRNLIAAALVLSPLMVHAQASSPAQPQAATNAPVMQSSLVQPAGLMLSSSSAADTATASVRTVRVSTGVVAPKLVHVTDIPENTINIDRMTGGVRTAVVEMVVDETGKPSDLKIIQSAGADLDDNVLAAVSEYRFRPGTVSGQKVAIPVRLHINIESAR